MKVAVLSGGASFERAVSLRSGERIGEVLERLGHDVIRVDSGPDAARQLREEAPDAAFIALHGRGGEDGGAQSLLELLGIPYTGTRAAQCEVVYDKSRAKAAMQAAGVATPPFVTLGETAIEQLGAADALARIPSTLGMPLVVKPARGGSSMGVRFVDDPDVMARSLLGALSYDASVVIERHVEGREFAVAIVELDHEVRVLPPVEIAPRNASWYDYESTYEHGETEFTCPPLDLPDPLRTRIESAAREAWDALGLRGIARVDLILDDAGTAWVLEAALVPGMTSTSIIPIACTAGGISFDALVAAVLADAVR